MQFGDGMMSGYLNPSKTRMRFDFLSLLDMSKVTNKYMCIGYEDEKGKIYPYTTPLTCLNTITVQF